MPRLVPFFSTRLGMLEMVYSKADLWLAEYYDQRLVKPELWKLGEELRELLSADINVVLAIANDSHLMVPTCRGSRSPSSYVISIPTR